MSHSLQPHGMQCARLPCSPLYPGVCSNSCPLSQWCHSTISSLVVPVSSHLQSVPASGSFPMIWFFASGGTKYWSFSISPSMNIQGWFPLGLTGLISFLSKGLSRAFSSTTIQRHPFFGTQAFFMGQLSQPYWQIERP